MQYILLLGVFPIHCIESRLFYDFLKRGHFFTLIPTKTERPRSVLALTPMLSVVIGLAAAIVIGGLAIILALRVPCGKRRKRKEITQGNITGEGSPGPSDKSIGSKEIDGNESDEKNPDIIPDTMDSDDQVCCNAFYVFILVQ